MNNKDQKRCKVGELRPSQALTTFGIGSIIDLPNLSVMVMGLEDWPLKDTIEIGEQRLLASVNRIEGQGEYDCLLAFGANVASACSVYYWPQENRAKDDNGKIGILHVKCAVADGHRMFLSSANFTEYAFTINMELGLLVTGGKLPGQVERHFEKLVSAGTLFRV